MDVLIIILVIAVCYVLPFMYAWRYTRAMHLKVWEGLKPGGWDIFFVIVPVANVIVCLEAIINRPTKKAGRTFAEKFFRL